MCIHLEECPKHSSDSEIHNCKTIMNLIIQLRLSNIDVSTFSDEEYVISLNSCTELKYIYPYCVLSPFLVLSLSANKKKNQIITFHSVK